MELFSENNKEECETAGWRKSYKAIRLIWASGSSEDQNGDMKSVECRLMDGICSQGFKLTGLYGKLG